MGQESWTFARDNMFVSRLMGTDSNAMIQRVTDLNKTERGERRAESGERAIILAVADLVEDSVIGDNARAG